MSDTTVNNLQFVWYAGEGKKGSRSYFGVEGLLQEVTDENDKTKKYMEPAKLAPGRVLGILTELEDYSLPVSAVNAKRLDREFPKISLSTFLQAQGVSIENFLISAKEFVSEFMESEDTGVSSPDAHASNLLASLIFGEIPENSQDIRALVTSYLTDEKVSDLLTKVQKKAAENGRYEDGSIRPRKPKTPKGSNTPETAETPQV